MLRKIGFWYVLAVATAGQAFGQDGSFLKETRVLGGRVVETFVPDQPPQPMVDPAFQAPQPQLQQQLPPPQAYQYQQQHQHQNGCGCPVCARRILSQRSQQRSKTIVETTTVTVEELTHPPRVINVPPPPQPCPPRTLPPVYVPPRNPCCPPYGNRPVYQGQGGYGGYAYGQRPQGIFSALFGINSGISVRTTGGNQGYGGYGGYGGYPPPYAQSGQVYAGSQPWYGGRQW